MTTIDRFLGLDLRGGDRPPGALAIGDNVLIDSRGSAVRRPGLVRVASPPAGSIGLHVVDDTLRALAPNGTSTAGLFPALLLDYVPYTAISGRSRVVRLPSGKRVAWIENADGQPVLCSTALPPATAGGATLTGLFAPLGVVMDGGRLYSIDRDRRLVRWSGIADPDVNDGLGYAGGWDPTAVEVRQRGGYVTSAVTPGAVATYRGRLAVLGRDGTELYQTDPEGGVVTRDQDVRVGTAAPLALADLAGDLVFLDGTGLVRTLDTATQTEAAVEAAPGAPVVSGTASLVNPIGLYSRQVGAYLVGEGNVLWCWSYLPGAGSLGWSRWVFPADVVITALAECRGRVYLRSAAQLWTLGFGIDADEVAVGDRRGITCTVEPTELIRASELVTTGMLSVLMTGNASVAMIRDGLVPAGQPFTGTGQRPAVRRGSWVGRTQSVRISAAGAPAHWRLDGLSLE